ncbi:hypothetical protein Bca4012_016907 [Brassica carinata]
MTYLSHSLLFFSCSLSLLICVATAGSRPAHGPAYLNPSAFSPEAYDFFHPKSPVPDNNPPRNSHSLPFLSPSPSPSPSKASNVEADTQGSKVSSDEHISKSRREEGGGETPLTSHEAEPSRGRTKETIVMPVKRKIGPSVYNLTTLDDAEKVSTSGNKVVLGYLNSLVLYGDFVKSDLASFTRERVPLKFLRVEPRSRSMLHGVAIAKPLSQCMTSLPNIYEALILLS